ncbi:MAG: hypothetical protein L3J35_11595 [Bacteroidales bacterium]|nr:hypothetical protein [Bacteroidales bacterium]
MTTKIMRYFIIPVFFIFFSESFGQVVTENVINVKADIIFADGFDNLYVLSENSFIKYNSKGKEIFSFYPEAGDKITNADVRNSLKVILFFEDQNKIIVLDNKLSKISNEIYLDKFNIFGDAVICGSTIGGYWIYDNINSRLLKLNVDFILEYKKDLNISEEIISISDNSENVFLQKSSREFISYDFNAGVTEDMQIYKASERYSFINDEIVFYSGNVHGLTFFNWKKSEYRYIKLPKDISITNAVLGKSKVFFFNKYKVYISKIREE